MYFATNVTQFEEYMPLAKQVAQRLLQSPDAAADAVQIGLIKAHRAFAPDECQNVRAWFLRIVTNTCYDMLRYQKRRATQSLEQLFEEFGDKSPACAVSHRGAVEQQIIEEESYQTLLCLIAQLPEAYRLVLVRIDVEGYEYQEVADQLGVPIGTIKSRLFRARTMMRDRLVAAGMVNSCEKEQG